MPIISTRDIENSKSKKNVKDSNKNKRNKQTKTEKSKGTEGETMVKGSELNDFIVHLS